MPFSTPPLHQFTQAAFLGVDGEDVLLGGRARQAAEAHPRWGNAPEVGEQVSQRVERCRQGQD
jgi:hypothetical protein